MRLHAPAEAAAEAPPGCLRGGGVDDAVVPDQRRIRAGVGLREERRGRMLDSTTNGERDINLPQAWWAYPALLVLRLELIDERGDPCPAEAPRRSAEARANHHVVISEEDQNVQMSRVTNVSFTPPRRVVYGCAAVSVLDTGKELADNRGRLKGSSRAAG